MMKIENFILYFSYYNWKKAFIPNDEWSSYVNAMQKGVLIPSGFLYVNDVGHKYDITLIFMSCNIGIISISESINFW